MADANAVRRMQAADVPCEPRDHGALTPGLQRNQSLKRAVRILRELAVASEAATTSELAVAVGLPRPTVARMLATLADAGLAERLGDGGGWVLGYEATRLGRAADPYGVLIRRARPHLEELTAQTGETSVLAVTRLPLDVEIVSQVDAPNLLGMTNWVGRSFGLHASVSGKLAYARLPAAVQESLVASQDFEAYTEKTITSPRRFLDEIRRVHRQGYAVSVDELEMGLTLIGVDVAPRSPEPNVIASVGIMGPTSRIGPRHDKALAAVSSCSRALSEFDW